MMIDPLPVISINHVLGLCDVLDERGGREDVYKLARELNYKLGDLLLIIRAAEMLGLVTTPGGDIVLEPLGKQVAEGDTASKKAVLRAQMEGLTLFQYFLKLLGNAPEGELDKDTILEELAILMPNENPKTSFQNLVSWGRFADLFGYSRDTNQFFLQQKPEEHAE
jgi:NitT/TauT family transport system ATP-binding protein